MDRIKDSARAHPPTRLDQIADRVELELHRLRKNRPHLDEHIDRASNILVLHLANLARRRDRGNLVRVRVGADGRANFLVRSINSRGAVYVINPSFWSCSCPSYHRRSAPCKHVLAAFALWQAAKPVRQLYQCEGCQESSPRGELVEVTHDHESEHWFPGDLLCKPCAQRSAVPW